MAKKPRNPVARQLAERTFQQRVVPKASQKATKGDRWDRKGKHKRSDPTEFQVGDRIKIERKGKEVEALVKQPKAPRGQLGISVDGKYDLVEPGDAKVIEESLLRLQVISESVRLDEGVLDKFNHLYDKALSFVSKKHVTYEQACAAVDKITELTGDTYSFYNKEKMRGFTPKMLQDIGGSLVALVLALNSMGTDLLTTGVVGAGAATASALVDHYLIQWRRRTLMRDTAAIQKSSDDTVH